MRLLGFFCLLFISCVQSAAEPYRFAAIQSLHEQQVGALVLQSIYERLNLAMVISPLPAKRAQKLAGSGVLDGEIMRIWEYGEQQKDLIRVPTPYYSLETRAFYSRSRPVILTSESDLARYRVVAVRGVKHTELLTQKYDIHLLKDTINMLTFVDMDRADIALTNYQDGLSCLAQLHLNRIDVSPLVLGQFDLYHYIHKQHRQLVPLVDGMIQDLKASGELQQIIAQAEAKLATVNDL